MERDLLGVWVRKEDHDEKIREQRDFWIDLLEKQKDLIVSSLFVWKVLTFSSLFMFIVLFIANVLDHIR